MNPRKDRIAEFIEFALIGTLAGKNPATIADEWIATKMNPPLPGALIEREKICDLCSVPTTIWVEDVEMDGSTYTLCAECADDHNMAILDALAKADAAGAAEDAAQEEL